MQSGYTSVETPSPQSKEKRAVKGKESTWVDYAVFQFPAEVIRWKCKQECKGNSGSDNNCASRCVDNYMEKLGKSRDAVLDEVKYRARSAVSSQPRQKVHAGGELREEFVETASNTIQRTCLEECKKKSSKLTSHNIATLTSYNISTDSALTCVDSWVDEYVKMSQTWLDIVKLRARRGFQAQL